MKSACEALQASTLSQKTQSLLQRAKVSQATQDFASNFPSLQRFRHLADYDPASQFGLSNAVSLVDSAELAMQAFDRIPADETLDVLAFLMVRPRFRYAGPPGRTAAGRRPQLGRLTGMDRRARAVQFRPPEMPAPDGGCHAPFR